MTVRDELGAHVSIAGGVARARARGQALGCGAIQIFVKMLDNLEKWMEKAAESAKSRSFDVDVLAQARLAPDQFSFAQQVQSACDQAKYAAAYLGGEAPPSHPDTETTFAEMMAKPDEGFDRMAPENVAPLVVWLGSEAAGNVTGRVFEVEGGVITVADGWRRGPSVDKGARWEPADVGPAVADLLAKAEPPVPVYGA